MYRDTENKNERQISKSLKIERGIDQRSIGHSAEVLAIGLLVRIVVNPKARATSDIAALLQKQLQSTKSGGVGIESL